MPRPGPRPYECVRRAWHSERHQPMRGSLIQEIFRLVGEVHSSTTKKNKEWQEKLPVVVLKAEEIMYSKANSEAEYMDLKTLWDRTNDAINTIIRRDESTETGNLLQPCIEAALNLGCVARRASRSQRNNSLRCYLSSCAQEPNDRLATDYSIFMNPLMVNSTQSGSPLRNHVCHNKNVANHKFLCHKVPLPNENHPSSTSWKVYLLHYACCSETSKSAPNPTEPIEVSPIQVNTDGRDLKTSSLDANEIVCDLSLRLGSPSHTLPGKLGRTMPEMDKEFLVLNGVGVNDLLVSHSCKLTEHNKTDAPMKKRTAVVSSGSVEECSFWRQRKIPCDQLTSKVENFRFVG